MAHRWCTSTFMARTRRRFSTSTGRPGSGGLYALQSASGVNTIVPKEETVIVGGGP